MAEKKPVGKATRTAKPAARKAVKGAKAAKKPAAHPRTPSDSSDARRPASELITARIRELQDWRGDTLAVVRRLIHQADPAILEEWKWDTPVWSHDGIVCTGESYKQVVKLTFAKGAFLADPHRLFNAGLSGNVRRAIDFRADDEVDAPSFLELIREAVAFNKGHSAGEPRSADR